MRFKLATKISLTIAGVVTLAVLSSVVAVFAAHQSNRLMERMVTENLASVVAAQELQIALMEQRGFVTSYILDEGNRAWLDELERKEPAFQRWLAEVRATAYTSKERAVLADVEEVFNQYDAKRDEAVALYDMGDVEAAKCVVLRDVKTAYDQAHKLCEDYVAANQRIVQRRTAQGSSQIRRLTFWSVAAWF